jgi:hypothetical protein
VAAGYLLFARRHPLAAGIAFGLGAGMAKPHLLLGALVFLLFGRALTAVLSCVATAVVVNLLAVAVLGPGTASGFAVAVLHSGIDHPPSSLVGVAGLFASWLGNGTPVRVVGLVVSTLLFALCGWLGVISRRAPRAMPQLFAAALAIGLLASPHLLVPDLVVVIPAFIWLYPFVIAPARWVAAPELLLWVAWVWIAVASVMDAANGSVGFPGRLVPWGLILFAVIAWRSAPGVTVLTGEGQIPSP